MTCGYKRNKSPSLDKLRAVTSQKKKSFLLKDFLLSHCCVISIGTLDNYLIFGKLHFQYYSKTGYSSRSEKMYFRLFSEFLQKS